MLSQNSKRQIKKWGLWRALYAFVMVQYRHRFMLSMVIVRPVQREARASAVLDSGRELRMATLPELSKAVADSGLELDIEWAKQAFARGDICYAVFEGERILTYTWRAFQPTPHEKGLEIRFNPRYVYGYYAYTHPLYRCQGLQNAVDYFSDQALQKLGYSEGIGFIESYYYPSIIAQMKRGASKVGYAGYLCLFGKVFTFRSPGAKKHGFGFFHAAPESAGLLSWSPKAASGESQRISD